MYICCSKKINSIWWSDLLKNEDAVLVLCTHLFESLEVLTCQVSVSVEQCSSFGRNFLMLPVVGVGLIRSLTRVTLLRICLMCYTHSVCSVVYQPCFSGLAYFMATLHLLQTSGLLSFIICLVIKPSYSLSSFVSFVFFTRPFRTVSNRPRIWKSA